MVQDASSAGAPDALRTMMDLSQDTKSLQKATLEWKNVKERADKINKGMQARVQAARNSSHCLREGVGWCTRARVSTKEIKLSGTYICISMCVCVCVCVYIYVYTSDTEIDIDIGLHVYLHVHTNTNTNTNTHTHTHTHAHTHIHLVRHH